ncbi:thioredoxin family protein [Tenacibaculum sp. 1B UA]|uniref:thioredoxin family protein n=1 Tax=Tenacibaculum sp. 1B UA TaxID=2922252 RepID=UPI002A24A0B2|nr:thioredoxin family protein [Tenacibaculum sp. 1B UA]MDX8553923.1 thioredoxin family protein [Tenacibaculum sp. 1B UA]
MKKIIQNSLEKALSYSEYRDLVSDLLAQGKSTGPNQSDDLLNYSKLNDKRMKRLDKTVKLTEETLAKIKDVKEPQTWLVLTEGWCGDAAQNLPVINKIAEENPNINLKLVLRDENLELMDEFLTNGGRSIPKLIALNKENEVINTWGPRPTTATKMVVDYKEKHGSLDADFKTDLQVWYNKNKGENTQEDLVSMLQ